MRAFSAGWVVLLWMVSWISLPGIGAIQSAADLDSQPHKLAIKVVLFGIILKWLVIESGGWAKFQRHARPFLWFILLNVALLPLSDNIFYSSTRLLEFSFMVASCFLMVNGPRDAAESRRLFRVLFVLLTAYIAVALLVFFLNPDWGAKISGMDADTGEIKYRFGGAFLRVDLVAGLSGACLMYWLFNPGRAGVGNMLVNRLGIIVTVVALGLAHSRSALIAGTAVIGLFYAFYQEKSLVKTAIAIAAIGVGCAYFSAEVVDFYTRGESLENIQTGSGRTYLISAIVDANEWYNFVIGNGYLMNSPKGLYFRTEGLGTEMASPHNGYFSVLLGTGVLGLVLCASIHWKIIHRLGRIRRSDRWNDNKWLFPTFWFLTIITFFDYGIWGVTSPALMVFCFVYFGVTRLAAELRARRRCVWTDSTVPMNVPGTY